MDDDEIFTYNRPSRKLRWQNIVAVSLSGLGVIIDGVADTLEGVASLLMQDANYADDRAAFHEEAAIELETLFAPGEE